MWSAIKSCKIPGVSFDVRSSILNEFSLVRITSTQNRDLQIKARSPISLFVFVNRGSIRISSALAGSDFDVVTAGVVLVDCEARVQIAGDTHAYLVGVQRSLLASLDAAVFRQGNPTELSAYLSASSPVVKALMQGLSSLEAVPLEYFRSSPTKSAWYFFVLSIVTGWPRIDRSRQSSFDHSQSIVSSAIRYMDANLGKELRVHQLADAANTSSSSLLRAFKEKTGISPLKYLSEHRLNRARELLESAAPGASIGKIAISVGYRYQSHFSRAYRQRFGVMPKAAIPAKTLDSKWDFKESQSSTLQTSTAKLPNIYLPVNVGPFFEQEALFAVPDFSTGEFYISKGLSQLFDLPVGKVELRRFASALGLKHPEAATIRHLLSGDIVSAISTPTVTGNRWFRLLPVTTAPVSFLFLFDVTDHVMHDSFTTKNGVSWREIFESSGLGVWENNVALESRFQSRSWLVMRGFNADDKFEDNLKHWVKRLHPDDVERVVSTILRHNNGELSQFEVLYRERRIDGKIAHILARGRVAEWSLHRKPLIMNGTDLEISSVLSTFGDQLWSAHGSIGQ